MSIYINVQLLAHYWKAGYKLGNGPQQAQFVVLGSVGRGLFNSRGPT